ncbi:MAG TPA: EAL domain-containing protein [Steroidobacteraceae bacterium]|nr:EAL domain-containing protein [Steroidobacteraceae bacterium]
MTLSIVLGVIAIALAVIVFMRHRAFAAFESQARRLEELVREGRFDERLEGEGEAARLAAGANAALEQLTARDRSLLERDLGFDALLGAVSEATAIHRETIQFANQRFAGITGAADPRDLIGQRFSELVARDYADLVDQQLESVLDGDLPGTRLEIEMQVDRAKPLRFEMSLSRISYRGQPAVLVGLVEMAPHAAATPKLRSSAWQTLDSMDEGVLTTDAAGRIDYMNQAAEHLTGVAAADAIGKSLTDVVALIDETDRRPITDPVRQCLATRSRVTFGRRGVTLLRAGDEERSIDLSATPLRNSSDAPTGAVIVLRDVSELRGLTRQMSYQASHDALTGLVNRREFERRLQDAIDTAHSTDGRHVLCYLDLDRFKAVNDTSGHMAGDSMLREVAALIKGSVRDSDTVGRLGGDEFGLLLIGCPLEKARQIADDVVRAVNDYRFVWKDKIFNIGVSIGLVEISRESGSIDDAMTAADSACYVAKRQGGHVHVYSAHDEAVARQRGEIHWLQKLQGALKEHRFELLAQPIMPTSAAVLNGPALEVLLRLREEGSSEGVSPSEFLLAAERYRLMGDVDRWVVQTALAALGRGGIRLPAGRSLAINLSGQTLGDPQFLEFVVDCLDRTGVSPQQVCFEVTENAVITNIEHARRFIGVLHGMGCQFALDDFGRGLSSFGNLKNLALDYLKIDGSFIRNLASDTVNQAMVAAMIKLARTLNFRVIAEQVEDTGALEAVRRMGVDFVQGYQLGRPQPLARVVSPRP